MTSGKGKEMEKRYVTIAVLAIAAVIILFGALPSGAMVELEPEEGSIPIVMEEDERGLTATVRIFSKKEIDEELRRLHKTDPERAKELEALREKDPEKFKAELREVMIKRRSSPIEVMPRLDVTAKTGGGHRIVIQQFHKKKDLEQVQTYFLGYGIQTIIEQRGPQFLLLTKDTYENPQRAGTDGAAALKRIKEIGAGYEAPSGYESFAPRLFSDAYAEKYKAELRKHMAEVGSKGQKGEAAPCGCRSPRFPEWLEENYPEVAKELAELKERDPRLHKKRYSSYLQKYRKVYEASKENPELAEILKEDLELKEQRDELLEQIGRLRIVCDESSDHETKMECEEKISTCREKMEEVLTKRFDLIVRRKEIEYEQLLEKLKKLAEQVEKSSSELSNWRDPEFMKDNVRARLAELLGERDRFRWD